MDNTESTGSESMPSNDSPAGDGRPRQPQGSNTWNAFLAHVTLHKLEFAQLMTRIFTLLFTVLYLFPFVGNPYSSYYKALMSSAATNALRLHQRLPRFQFSREFMSHLVIEDSCHYLFYSIIFIYAAPITLVLIPVFLFALFQAASYSQVLLDVLGHNSWWGARVLINFIEFQGRNLLRLAAFTEIFLMPFHLLLLLTGRCGLLTPFVYYRFLTMRYASRRNPHTRNMFRELRLAVESTVGKPGCPLPVRNFAHGAINFLCRLAPPIPVQQQQQQ